MKLFFKNVENSASTFTTLKALASPKTKLPRAGIVSASTHFLDNLAVSSIPGGRGEFEFLSEPAKFVDNPRDPIRLVFELGYRGRVGEPLPSQTHDPLPIKLSGCAAGRTSSAVALRRT